MPGCREVNCKHYYLSMEAGRWVRVCTPCDSCPLDFIKLSSLAYRLQMVKEMLDRHGDRGPGLAAFAMRDWPEIAQTNLSDLAWELTRDGVVHKNDVIGLIEIFEERWTQRQLEKRSYNND